MSNKEVSLEAILFRRPLTNDENLPPKNEKPGDDRSTPPGHIPATLGIGNWQHAAYRSAPFGLLSPNSKPSLARQRDHSACRQTDSPLRVRKRGERLKYSSIYGDVAPPCMHTSLHNLGNAVLPPVLSFTSATTLDSERNIVGENDLKLDNDLSGSTLLPEARGNTQSTPPLASPPLQIPSKVARHKSVSRRVLSRVKEGIAVRSRSSNGHKALDNDNSLMRRLSGRRKTGSEQQRQLQSFEISRESIDTETDDESESLTPQRSFTGSSIATDELMVSGVTLTPPSGYMNGSRQTSSRFASPSVNRSSPVTEPTPKANARGAGEPENHTKPIVHHVSPYIDVNILVDTDAVDFGTSKNVWVAVEATVRTRQLEHFSSNSTDNTNWSKNSIDMIMIICCETLKEYASTTQQCIVELCSRLEHDRDRLAVLLATSRQLNSCTISCTCAQIHPLQAPKVSALLERLGLAPSTAQSDLPNVVEDQPIQLALRDIAKQGVRQSCVHSFVLSKSPVYLAQAVQESMQWPSHTIKIGLQPAERSVAATHDVRTWSLELAGEGEISTHTLDNVCRDIRYGCQYGGIPSLRLCYKAMDRARVVEVVGDKATKGLRLGQRCSLFIKVCLPSIDTPPNAAAEGYQDSLFTELESIVGTLETNFLHVEARYRHTIFPTDNVITVRQICSMRRPKTESRWSLVTSAVAGLSSERVNAKLARFLITHYSAAKALNAISRWELTKSPVVQQLYDDLQCCIAPALTNQASAAPGPVVVVTDAAQTGAESVTRTASTTALTLHLRQDHLPRSTSTSAMTASRLITAPERTGAPSHVALKTGGSRESTPSDANDTAHILWQHLRRDSLPIDKMLIAMSGESLHQLEATDEDLKAIREKALANKRSIGADTLKACKWDDKQTHGTAPWL
ncbi:hypothetical protein CBER1_05743 [Cercospora berteroae]|uniref:Uncharacterized protein n=1 Tax=Cercospora berteroae TaxID=357750 RepID=A0A2S6BT23_9PEZI|nr:hypothetical protein CBER1_05743 [Cercospora berteroae]